ncbi:hypothetical protein LZ32DRAFT_619737 [Colletotrichum eremochloae]|nr:hypothetical protein LZ32DRAFT_619737 [Colletotrichum eremochloae]
MFLLIYSKKNYNFNNTYKKSRTFRSSTTKTLDLLYLYNLYYYTLSFLSFISFILLKFLNLNTLYISSLELRVITRNNIKVPNFSLNIFTKSLRISKDSKIISKRALNILTNKNKLIYFYIKAYKKKLRDILIPMLSFSLLNINNLKITLELYYKVIIPLLNLLLVAKDIKDIYKDFSLKLLALNIRDSLGSTKNLRYFTSVIEVVVRVYKLYSIYIVPKGSIYLYKRDLKYFPNISSTLKEARKLI